MENRKHSILKLIRHAQRRPEDDPSNTQTADPISVHYRNAKVGDIAVIRETYGGFLNFLLTEIDAIKGPRVYLADEPLYGGSAVLPYEREKLSQPYWTGPSRHPYAADPRLCRRQSQRQADQRQPDQFSVPRAVWI
jgi:hypothetical protein